MYKRQVGTSRRHKVLQLAEYFRLVNGEVGIGITRPETHTLAHDPVSYTHLRAHETVLDLVCRLLLEKKKTHITETTSTHTSTIRQS